MPMLKIPSLNYGKFVGHCENQGGVERATWTTHTRQNLDTHNPLQVLRWTIALNGSTITGGVDILNPAATAPEWKNLIRLDPDSYVVLLPGTITHPEAWSASAQGQRRWHQIGALAEDQALGLIGREGGFFVGNLDRGRDAECTGWQKIIDGMAETVQFILGFGLNEVRHVEDRREQG